MNREDIARIAREAGDDWDDTLPSDKEFLERFAALVAAAEREACVMELERSKTHLDGILELNASTYFIASRVTDYLAARIRAQGHGEAA